MAVILSGFNLYQGEVNSTKGNTIWLINNESQKETPLTLDNASIVDQTQPGHVLRVLLENDGVISRIYNKTTDIVYSIKDGHLAPQLAKVHAIKQAMLMGIPFLGMLYGALFVVSMSTHFITLKGPALSERMTTLLTSALIYSAALFGGLGLTLWVHPSFALIPLLGPGIAAYLGIKKLSEIDNELAEALSYLVKTGTPTINAAPA